MNLIADASTRTISTPKISISLAEAKLKDQGLPLQNRTVEEVIPSDYQLVFRKNGSHRYRGGQRELLTPLQKFNYCKIKVL